MTRLCCAVDSTNTFQTLLVELARQIGKKLSNPGLSPTVSKVTIRNQAFHYKIVQHVQQRGPGGLPATAATSAIPDGNQITDAGSIWNA